MAESLNKKNMSFLDDDIIKDTLKTGLSGIKASDDLVSKTLVKCKNEIDKTNETKKPAFSAWVYRLGAPLAAGALVLVLVLTSSQLLLGRKNANMAPQAAPSASAETLNDSGLIVGKAAARDEERADDSSAMPEIAFSEALTSEAPAAAVGDMKSKEFFGSERMRSAPIQSLNSYPNHSQNNSNNREGSPSQNTFSNIVDKYNGAYNIGLTLDESEAVRISAVMQDGVTAEMLSETKSYRDILSDEGYWLLPLKGTSGNIDTVLIVNEVNTENNDMPVSSSDVIYQLSDGQFVVSAHPEGALLGTNLNKMFSIESIRNMIKAQGYSNISEIIVADINYGLDFLVFANADGQELTIPFINNETLFGLENEVIYSSEELFKVVSQAIKQ